MPAFPSALRVLGLLLLLQARVLLAQQSEPGPAMPPAAPAAPAAPAPRPAAVAGADRVPGVSRATYIENHEDLPSATAVRTDQPIEVDGVLDEPIWMSAEPETDFWQFDPDEGLLYPERTEVRFVYDD